jgi:cytochrome c biogenesis protein CcdA
LTGCFALGLVVSSVLLGALAASAGESPLGLLQINRLFFWGFGVLLLVAGLFLSGLISPQVLPQRWQRIADHLGQAGLWGALLLGFGSGLLTIPACPACGAGIIVLGGMVNAGNLSLYGWMLFVSFALGQALPVLAVGAAAALLKPGLIKRLRTRMCSMEQRMQLLAGNVLVVLGLYYIVVG